MNDQKMKIKLSIKYFSTLKMLTPSLWEGELVRIQNK
jgi:hypothetical protein